MDLTKPAHLHSLAEALDCLDFGASCNDCKKGAHRLDAKQLLKRLRPNILVQDIRLRLRCSKGGDKNVMLTTLWKGATMSERMLEHWK